MSKNPLVGFLRARGLSIRDAALQAGMAHVSWHEATRGYPRTLGERFRSGLARLGLSDAEAAASANAYGTWRAQAGATAQEQRNTEEVRDA